MTTHTRINATSATSAETSKRSSQAWPLALDGSPAAIACRSSSSHASETALPKGVFGFNEFPLTVQSSPSRSRSFSSKPSSEPSFDLKRHASVRTNGLHGASWPKIIIRRKRRRRKRKHSPTGSPSGSFSLAALLPSPGAFLLARLPPALKSAAQL